MAREISTVLLTGASGFVGQEVEKVLRNEKYLRTFTVLRPGAESAQSSVLGSLVYRGELTDKSSIKPLFGKPVDAIIHMVGIINEEGGNTFERAHVETTRNLVELAKEHGVKKFIHMSALGTRENAKSRYHKTKYKAENLVKESGIPYTIFRPSVIFGNDCEFMRTLEFLAKFPRWTPYLGESQGRLQPVWVSDVARLFAEALTLEVSDGQTYDVGGPDAFPFTELVGAVEKHYGLEKIPWHLPSWVGSTLASSNSLLWPVLKSVLHKGSFGLLDGHLLPPTINEDQLIMMEEDNTCDPDPVQKAFSMKFKSFASWLTEGGMEKRPWDGEWKPRYKGEGPVHPEQAAS